MLTSAQSYSNCIDPRERHGNRYQCTHSASERTDALALRAVCHEQIEIAAQHGVELAGAPAAVAAAHERRRLAAIAAHHRARRGALSKRRDQRARHPRGRHVAERRDRKAHRAPSRGSRRSLPSASSSTCSPHSRASTRCGAESADQQQRQVARRAALDLGHLHVPIVRPGAIHVEQLPAPRSDARLSLAAGSSAGSTMSATSMAAPSKTSLMPSLDQVELQREPRHQLAGIVLALAAPARTAAPRSASAVPAAAATRSISASRASCLEAIRGVPRSPACSSRRTGAA